MRPRRASTTPPVAPAPWPLAARASSVPIPASGAPVANANPLANASPTRRPVNEPGPTVTTIFARSANATAASAAKPCTSVASRSWWPRCIGSEEPASTRRSSTNAAWQALRQVSITRIVTSGKRSRLGLPPTSSEFVGRDDGSSKGLLDPRDLGHVVAQQVLDAGLEGGGRRRAARTGASHVQPHHPGVRLEAREQDVAAVRGHGRADAGI